MSDDAELVRKSIQGDRLAAGAIYDRFSPLVRAIAWDATSRPQEVDELVQEIFLRVLTHLGQLRQGEALAGWIVQVARRQVVDFARHRGKQQLRESPLAEDSADSTHPRPGEDVDRVRSAIAQLDENERLAVHLFYLAEQPAEVARQVLGLSSSGFYKLIERARAQLRRLLASQESSS